MAIVNIKNAVIICFLLIFFTTLQFMTKKNYYECIWFNFKIKYVYVWIIMFCRKILAKFKQFVLKCLVNINYLIFFKINQPIKLTGWLSVQRKFLFNNKHRILCDFVWTYYVVYFACKSILLNAMCFTTKINMW